jgi:hypothetical protein
MVMGGWKTAAMFRRYAIVSSADQRAAIEMLERAREQRAGAVTADPLSIVAPEPVAAKGAKPN